MQLQGARCSQVKTSTLANSVQVSYRGASPRRAPAHACPAVDGSSYFVLQRSFSDENNSGDEGDGGDYVQKQSSSGDVQHAKYRCLKYTC